MKLAQRIDRLETAHRALLAQHTALMTVCQVVLPLIAQNSEQARGVLDLASAISEETMNTLGHDKDQQRDVLHWIAVLSEAILVHTRG